MVQLFSWNCCDRADALVDQIEGFDADVVVLPEAFAENDTARAHMFVDYFRGRYDTVALPYKDDDDRRDRHLLVMMVKSELGVSIEPISLGTRQALLTKIGDVTLVGVHLDDRSEARRYDQARTLRLALDNRPDVVILGDFNAGFPAMNGRSVLRPAAALWRICGLPRGEPGMLQSRSARVGSLLTRLDGMLRSQVIGDLEDYGFVDADTRHQPTMLATNRLPVAQLDHIMVRGAIRVCSFRRLLTATGSDHLPITADVR